MLMVTCTITLNKNEQIMNFNYTKQKTFEGGLFIENKTQNEIIIVTFFANLFIHDFSLYIYLYK